MTRSHRATTAALLSLFPCLAQASGDVSGAYVAFFLVPVIGIWSVVAVAIGLRGTLIKKLALGLLSSPFSIAVYVIVDLGLRHSLIQDYPAQAVWPNIVGAAVAAFLPIFATRLLNRATPPSIDQTDQQKPKADV
jgi:hypothetical protein